MAKLKIMTNPDFAKLPATKSGAAALKLPYYYTGKVCAAGHLHLRYASSGNCVVCTQDRVAKARGSFRSDRSEENIALAVAAMASGITTYIPTKPCKIGHRLRYVGSNNCVECDKATVVKRRDAGTMRWSRIKKEYGLTQEQYYAMLASQDNCCGVCRNAIIDEKKSHVDHNHATGKVRGILCGTCNQGIGLLKESVSLMQKAIVYLNTHGHANPNPFL